MLGRTVVRGQPEPILPEPAGDPRLTAALDTIEDAIVICDETGETVFRNEAAERLLTPRPGDALLIEAVADALDRARAGEVVDRRLDLITPVRRTLAVRAIPLSEDDVTAGAVAVVDDISERMRLEAVRRDFVANVSHELKTPLGAMTLLAETIDGESDPEVVARLARRMGAEAERLSRIVDDLLDLSRIESNEAAPTALAPVAEIVGEAIGGLRDVSKSLEVAVHAQDIPAGVLVRGNRRDLVSAVANLVDNAIKYSEAGDVVTVDVRTTPTQIEVVVQDQGVGIPSRDMERIFERFYRVDRARSRATGGTGLGLSIVRNVAANHGGSVSVDSKEGHGSTFVLQLPRPPEAEDA
jgi:two-component system sensor histidine kinase SenX3